MRLMNAVINPLSFLELDRPGPPTDPKVPSPESVLSFLCPDRATADVASLVKRYREISPEPVSLVAVPAEQRILDKLAWPLRHAKASYMVGNYLAVIALCGMVAEMVALLIWETAEKTDGLPTTAHHGRRRKGTVWRRLRATESGKACSGAGNVQANRRGRRRALQHYPRDATRLSPSVVSGP